MDQATITELTRRGVRNPRLSSTDIASMTIYGAHNLGHVIKSCAPTFFTGRALLSSLTHIFTMPSDCEMVNNVFDVNQSSLTVTDATNASPINIECVGHSLTTGTKVFIYGVGGNTAANGTFKITYVGVDDFTLQGAAGNAAYTSGGLLVPWGSGFTKMRRKNPDAQSMTSRFGWYPEGRTIVIDSDAFDSDILIDYIKRPDAIDDIPDEYHMGLVAWNVMNMIVMPPSSDPSYSDMVSSYQMNQSLYKATIDSIRASLIVSSESHDFTDSERWDVI